MLLLQFLGSAPDSVRLCGIIDRYASKFKNESQAGGTMPEDDEELCTLFDAMIEAVPDSEGLVNQVKSRT